MAGPPARAKAEGEEGGSSWHGHGEGLAVPGAVMCHSLCPQSGPGTAPLPSLPRRALPSPPGPSLPFPSPPGPGAAIWEPPPPFCRCPGKGRLLGWVLHTGENVDLFWVFFFPLHA